MSSEALPISPARFAKALEDLSIGSLHSKVAELRNSIAHLEASNKELEHFARENDDRDCYEYLLENRQVIKSMEERIELVKREIVEVRGMPFEPQEVKTAPATQNGTATATQNGTSAGQAATNGGDASAAAVNGEEEEGVFL
ncbi:hypothetical protein K491DRAFT_325251 [Lophiostoma macrostomum CBS 122681]|uniref:Uncharacterized protein n=1 Tax=Lophiostoma macrostomum CBS 122681 TaxID=1314788 RepID=A0A6A6TDN3_9PLEO|nr:hypothetical protein K491DRAFT_325251 [Lophiostoma macrostomum CBS 122681]